MKVVSVLNQKGGSGKTTIATHLARALQLFGYEVILIDSDPQGSARDWAAMKEDQPVTVVGIDRPTIQRDLRHLATKDYAIIDGAPRAADLALSAIKSSSFIIIPVQPSPYDIWATADLVSIVKERIDITDGQLSAAFLVSRSIKNTIISSDIASTLEEYELPVFKTRITQRVAYPTTASSGTTVLDEAPKGEAAAEINSIARELLTFLSCDKKAVAV